MARIPAGTKGQGSDEHHKKAGLVVKQTASADSCPEPCTDVQTPESSGLINQSIL